MKNLLGQVKDLDILFDYIATSWKYFKDIKGGDKLIFIFQNITLDGH